MRSRHAPNSRIRPDAVERMIEQTWAGAVGKAQAKLFDGPMCRLESWRASPDSLELVLSLDSYKAFFGTNLNHATLADTYGREALANPVGLSAALITADNFLMLGRRNEAVAYYPLRTHPFAGSLEPADAGDLFAAMRRELVEELAFTADDISGMRCLGLIEDQSLRQPEAVLCVQSHRRRSEIESRLDAAEHHASRAICLDAHAFEVAIHDPSLTPVAIGTLLLCGGANFSATWLEETAKATNIASARV